MCPVHSCSNCDMILLNSHPTSKSQKSFELPVSSLLEFASGPNPCSFFKTLLEKCRWPQGYLDTNRHSKIAILFDDNIDSSYVLGVATLPRKPAPPTRHVRSATERYGELLA